MLEILFFAVIALLTNGEKYSSWNQYGRDSSNSFYSPYQQSTRQNWTIILNKTIQTGEYNPYYPLLDDQNGYYLVYGWYWVSLSEGGDRLYSIDVATGEILSTTEMKVVSGSNFGTPIVTEEGYYCLLSGSLENNASVYSIDPRTGEEMWRYTPAGGYTIPTYSSVITRTNNIIIFLVFDKYGSTQSTLYAIKHGSKTPLWNMSMSEDSVTTRTEITVDEENNIYLVNDTNYLLKASGDTGEILAYGKLDNDDPIAQWYTKVVISKKHNLLFVLASWYPKPYVTVAAYDLDSLKEKWRIVPDGISRKYGCGDLTLSLDEEEIYFVCSYLYSSLIYAISSKDGSSVYEKIKYGKNCMVGKEEFNLRFSIAVFNDSNYRFAVGNCQGMFSSYSMIVVDKDGKIVEEIKTKGQNSFGMITDASNCIFYCNDDSHDSRRVISNSKSYYHCNKRCLP